jgi:thiamine pyrophosphate-dependent acetolactate synthase large subunit-like protein
VLSESIDAAVKSVAKNPLFNVAEPGFEPNRVDAKKVAEMLKDKKKILVLTGAGMSAASGIPTFRGANGFWKKEKVEIGSKE